nr:hypothetical protein [Tanacetum cinerariifolium]
MDVPLSPDRVFDFYMDELEPHPAYAFFAAEPIPGLAEAPKNMNRHGALVKKMGTMSDSQMADSIVVGEIWPRVAIVEGHVQVMAS